ncbi:sec1 family domain-containing protein 2 isoform X3 [Physeter macrocephalus]|uniref:Sec1 family domain-containing protein 2 isoform X3 n=1 Tax=Physeter macrocephalus TaxID=9755 RepID=A0A455BUX9_PHYMC|nr:sec1 family domain-containing protein 2 isoform X3 [Physeter catodon]|eukprot:XP_028347641.1 sec1 family domain-containing protein 2 isoform X4 [Physeter catodon]
MSTPGVLSFTQQAWEQVLAKVKRAVVYLDAACAESLHWGCGSSRLLEAVGNSACYLREFEPAAVGGGAEHPKAVFVLSCLLKGRTVETLRDIICRSHFQYCVVVTAVNHAVHLTANHVPPAAAAELEGQQPVFEQLEEKLCEWMGNMNYTAEVLHVPLLLAPAAPHLALTPAFASLFPLLPQDVHILNRARPDKRRLGNLAEVDATTLTPELLLTIRCLVSGLSSLCEHLGVREECFAVGSLSRIIAADLANFAPAKNRRKTATGRASVVFVDRTLDLTGAVGHHGDNLVEKILSVLPQLPGHTNDVMVNMVELTALQAEEENQNIVAPGCLAQSNDPAAKALWEALLNTKHKEAVMEVRRHLVEAASRENLPIKMSMGRVTPGQLTSYIHLFKNNLKALRNHCGLLQLGLATVQTLKHLQTAKWDNFLAFERLLLQSIGESTMSVVLNQLLPMIKPSNQRTNDDYSPEELLVLLIYIYSVSGEFSVDKDLGEGEEKVKKALAQVFCEESELSPLLQKITGCDSSINLTFHKSRSAMDELFTSLRDIAGARNLMKQFKSVYVPGNHTHQASYKPLLKQVVEEIFNPERPDPVDIEHMSSGLTDLLKTGFSMFMKLAFLYKSDSPQKSLIPRPTRSGYQAVSRPHPSDHTLLILFVVGGVTVSEAKMIKDLVPSLKPGAQVIVLSTRLLKPTNIPELLFTTDRLHPDLGF